jgi:hypothetical protein
MWQTHLKRNRADYQQTLSCVVGQPSVRSLEVETWLRETGDQESSGD